MDERYVFEDKFAIANHEKCWQDLIRQVNEGDFPTAFFSTLAQKTRELLLVYDTSPSVPKEMLRLISLLFRYTECTLEENTPFSLSCILIEDMVRAFQASSPMESGEKTIVLHGMCYTVNVETFDMEHMTVKPYENPKYLPKLWEKPPKGKRKWSCGRERYKRPTTFPTWGKWEGEDE